MRISLICPKHGYKQGDHCPECVSSVKKSELNVHIGDSWVSKTTFEHIDPKNPNLRFNSKKELLDYCKKMETNERTLIPKAFMKPKSQGPGYEAR